MPEVTTLPPIKLESFEGPFDLLIELARKRKIDLTTISLRSITDDFLEYIRGKSLPLSLQGDFMVVAATLILVKIRQLLPSLTQEEEQEITELTDRIRIYQMYRSKAEFFITQWNTSRLFPPRFWGAGEAPIISPKDTFPKVDTKAVQAALLSVISKVPKPPQPRAHLRVQGKSLQEWLHIFTTRLGKVKKLVFQDMLQGSSRQDTAVSFLALLEMARKQEISISQDDHLSHITVDKKL